MDPASPMDQAAIGGPEDSSSSPQEASVQMLHQQEDEPSHVNPDYPFTFARDQPNRSPVKVDRLVLQSIKNLRKREGATVKDIKKYLLQNTDVSVKALDDDIKGFLKQATESRVLCKNEGGKYCLQKGRPRKAAAASSAAENHRKQSPAATASSSSKTVATSSRAVKASRKRTAPATSTADSRAPKRVASSAPKSSSKGGRRSTVHTVAAAAVRPQPRATAAPGLSGSSRRVTEIASVYDLLDGRIVTRSVSAAAARANDGKGDALVALRR